MPTEVLTPLRHACTSCGGSCQGAYVRLFGDDETERITRFAGELGVADPIVDGRLRHDDGRCVFLGADQLCNIHRKFGMDAKPAVCKQFPLVAVRTEDGAMRVGLDPGCYSSRETWRTEPEVQGGSLMANPRPIPPSQHELEAWFLDATDGATVARALALLTGGDPSDTELPPDFASRLVERLHDADLAPLVATAAPAMRIALQPVLAAMPTWAAAAPPAWSIDPEDDAWAIHAVRTMVHLRLASTTLPLVAGIGILTLSGAVAASWAGLSGRQHGHAVSAWCRALRAPAFMQELVPSPSVLSWLATGR